MKDLKIGRTILVRLSVEGGIFLMLDDFVSPRTEPALYAKLLPHDGENFEVILRTCSKAKELAREYAPEERKEKPCE